MDHQSTTDRVRIHRAETVPEDARVRHIDELSERTQRALYEAEYLDGVLHDAPGLDDGDVVVFTDYFRVSAA